MNQPMRPTVLVDGNHVMGARPDGWWRNRAEAAQRLVAEIAPLVLDGGRAWTIAFDGPAHPAWCRRTSALSQCMPGVAAVMALMIASWS